MENHYFLKEKSCHYNSKRNHAIIIQREKKREAKRKEKEKRRKKKIKRKQREKKRK